MSQTIYSVITGTGCYIPTRVIKNEEFLSNQFYDNKHQLLQKSNAEIIEKFFEITTIAERRYATDDLLTSDIAHLAAEEAIKSAGIDRETLDYVIVAHNFGDVCPGSNRVDMVPCLAARVKHLLAIKNPETVAYDVPFGCPGWVQATIQADYLLRSGDAKRILVVGADILSRVSDPHDRDCMIFADGAGAVVLEATTSDTPVGILTHKTRSDTFLYSQMLQMGPSLNLDEHAQTGNLYIRMNGRRLYMYALEHVPTAIKACLDKANLHITDIDKVLIHQANGKMDDAILARLYSLYDMEVPEGVMPMTISWLGNSSVATIPTLLDLILKGQLPPHQIKKGETVVFASVGAGMNINAFVYKMA
jgi:3-oxoacyl-[acyl-carrier-protein] synthase III